MAIADLEQGMNGEVDPRFRIRAPLRCDGVGSLDCAEDTESGTRLAIRWLPLAANGEAAAKAVCGLPVHPVLPRIRGSGRVGAAAWVAMEFPEGRLLSTLLDEPLQGGELIRVGAALADALATLHAQGAVHGELSAESVLLLPDGAAIFWDVPLVMANRLTDRRGEERALGQLTTVAPFLAPERARGLPTSECADVYALGAVLCAAAGGQPPPGATTLAVLHQLATGRWTPELPRGLDPAARVVLARMVSADPLARPTAQEVAQALGAVRPLRDAEEELRGLLGGELPAAPPEPAPLLAANDDVAQADPPPPTAADELHALLGGDPAPSPSAEESLQELTSGEPSPLVAAVLEVVQREDAALRPPPLPATTHRAAHRAAPAPVAQVLDVPPVMLEPELQEAADALRRSRRRRTTIAVAVAGACAMLALAAVALLWPRPASSTMAARAQAAPPAPDLALADHRPAVATAAPQPASEPVVTDLLVPLVAQRDGFPSKAAKTKARATESRKQRPDRRLAPEPAAPAPGSEPEPQPVAAPTSELKRPDF